METVRELLDNVWGVLLSLRQTVIIWDIVDILIIAYLIYRILTVMRKTSASSVIKGIVLLLLIAWLSNLLNLKVITYLLNQTLQMGILVLVVLFQPELRRLFEHVGNSRVSVIFRKRAKLENVEAMLQSVIFAVDVMAKSKTGALIVFERDVGLNDYAASGTRVDALVTPELIQNIFFINSPLHDGALLIRDGRILAAACMLPLSNNINLGRDLGMRHRAGVGISERTDVVAVIVSEQTGAISVAVDGMLKRRLSKENFEMLLRSEFMLIRNNKAKKSKARKKVNKR